MPGLATARNESKNTAATSSLSGGGKAVEELLPLRLRGVRAAYGGALGTAAKLCLDKHTATVGGNVESATQAEMYLVKAVEVRVTQLRVGRGG